MTFLIRDLIFTPRCINCNQIGIALCHVCNNSLELIKRNDVSNIEEAKFANPYAGWLRERLIEYKSGNYELARGLAEVIYQNCISPSSNIALIPIPTSEEKLKIRGIDTIGHISKQLKILDRNIEIKPILRITKILNDQVGLSKIERISNLAGAFKSVSVISGEVILLDDVLTTGATLSAAALALKKSGAKTVKAIGLCSSTKMY
jgi:ComF family protein